MFEVADIHETMRFLECTYDEAIAWLDAEMKYLSQEHAWEDTYYYQ